MAKVKSYPCYDVVMRRAAKRQARLERGGAAMTVAERVRKHIRLTNDFTELPECADPEGREAARYDFVEFVHRYGAALLHDHQPSQIMIDRFLRVLERSVLNGGQVVVEMPRGKGKTTFIDLCAAWAIAYGHRKYLVLISATAKLGKVNLKNILKVLTSKEFAADFPEISTPFEKLEGKWQLSNSQTFNGVRTEIELKADHVQLPKLVNTDGAVMGDAGGSIIFSIGVGGAVRGLNEGGLRPDMIFFDDVQKRKDAKSVQLVNALEEFVNQDALGLFGHGAPATALMAITPICVGDFASVITDRERNPAWVSVKIPLVLQWPSKAELVDEFFALYKDDCANDDFSRTNSTAFFREHQKDFWNGVELLDDQDGADGEVDALHHVLLLVAKVGKDAFNAEYQMEVRESGALQTITADLVKHALNGSPEFVLPKGMDAVVGFCDVNKQAQSGLRWGLMAVGAKSTCAIIAYGKYPMGNAPLWGEETKTKRDQDAKIFEAVVTVGKGIASVPIRTHDGKRVRVQAFSFDGGCWTVPVSLACENLRNVVGVRYRLIWTLGRNATVYGKFKKKGKVKGDHMMPQKSENGWHIVFNSDYWRETAQSSFLNEPMMPGSCSLWGKDPVKHDQFATEASAEQLLNKYISPDGKMHWVWKMKNKMNHYGDVLTGCFVVASWERLYDSEEKMLDVRTAKPGIKYVGDAAVNPIIDVDARGDGSAVEVVTDAVTFRPARAMAAKRKSKFKFRYKLKK